MQSPKLIFCVGYFTFAAFLVVGSLAPLEFAEMGWSEALQKFQNAIDEGVDLSRGRSDLAVNFSIAIPIAFFAMGSLETLGVSALLAAPLAIASGVALAVGVEFGQVYLPTRNVSLRDILAQGLGHVAGVVIWLVLRRPTMAWAAAMPTRRPLGDRIVWLCYAYLLGVTFYLLLPMDLVSGPGELLRKFKSNQVEMVPFTFPYATRGEALYAYFCDTLRFVPVGILCLVGWSRESVSSLRHRWWEAVAVGVTIVIGLESAQLLIASRYTSITDVIFGSLGIVIGAMIAPVLVRRQDPPATRSESSERLARRPAPWLLAVIVYVVVLTLVFWDGGELIQDTELIRARMTGFYRDAWKNLVSGSDTGNIFGVLKKAAWFAPLGVLAGSVCWLSRTSGVFRFVLCLLVAGGCAGVCVVIELGQIPQPNHTPSVVDAGIGTFAAWGGMALASFIWRPAAPRPE